MWKSDPYREHERDLERLNASLAGDEWWRDVLVVGVTGLMLLGAVVLCVVIGYLVFVA